MPRLKSFFAFLLSFLRFSSKKESPPTLEGSLQLAEQAATKLSNSLYCFEDCKFSTKDAKLQKDIMKFYKAADFNLSQYKNHLLDLVHMQEIKKEKHGKK